MIIKIHKLNMIWSVIWTLDNGESWRAMACDTFGDALNLAARIGSMQCSL